PNKKISKSHSSRHRSAATPRGSGILTARIHRLTASFPTLAKVNAGYYLWEMVEDGALGVFTPRRIFSQRAADLKALLSLSSGRASKICPMAIQTCWFHRSWNQGASCLWTPIRLKPDGSALGRASRNRDTSSDERLRSAADIRVFSSA